MFKFAITFLPALAGLVAAATMGWLVWTLWSASENAGILEYGLMAFAVIGAGLSLKAAYQEGNRARVAFRDGSAFWEPEQPESQVIGAKAGNRYPMTEIQIDHVKKVLAALSTAGLMNEDGHIALIAAMEQEGYDDDIAAYETLLTLNSVFQEHDMEFDLMVFTHEHVEVSEESLKCLTQKLLAIAGYTVTTDDITINWPEAAANNGLVEININNVVHEIRCNFHGKNTPDGLIEGIAELIYRDVQKNGEYLYWENLDSSLLVAYMTPEAATGFNSTMESLNDQFRFEPVRPDTL